MQTIGGIACIVLALPCFAVFCFCVWNYFGCLTDQSGDAFGIGKLFTVIFGLGSVVSGIATGALVLLAWSSFAAPPAPPTFDEWLAVHKTTCPTCRRAFDECDGAMCVEAFEKFQESMRAEK